MTLLAVDAGRSEVEVKTEGGITAFSSSVSKARTLKKLPLSLNDLEIEVDGVKWWVGRLADDEGRRFKRNNYGESKVDQILKIQVIASAIYSGMPTGYIDLGILVPFNRYIPEERKNIRELLRGQHKFTYTLVEKGGVEPEIKQGEIMVNEKILISQEGVAAYWSKPQDEYTQTLDFGAKTINYCCHKANRDIVNLMSGTIYEGWEIMKDDHEKREIEHDDLTKEEKEIMAEELAQKAIDEVKLKGWSQRYKTQVFGGVAEDVFPFVKYYFPHAEMYPNPRNANVEGLYEILKDVFVHA